MSERGTKEQAFRYAARQLAEARLAYAKAFLIAKAGGGGMPVSDKTAEYTATEMTLDTRTTALAEYEVALLALKGASE